ncbi:hypothetical protein ACF0H5_011587 [Mactra antiquata]
MNICCFNYVNIFFIVMLSYEMVKSEERTWQEAEEYCNQTGLYSRDSILNDKKVKDNLLDELKDGESLWVQEHVEYSLFIGYKGCFRKTTNFSNFKTNLSLNEQDSFYKCITHCVGDIHERQYIGAMGSTCYCFSLTEYSSNVHAYISDQSDCSSGHLSLFYSGKYKETDQNIMTVYENLPNSTFSFIGSDKKTGQCVYTKRTPDRQIYLTESCFEYSDSKGFICGNGEKIQNDVDKCNAADMCLINQPTDILSAELECKKLGSKLRMEPIDAFQDNGEYLTGLFRVIKFSPGSNVCLSLRKYNDTFVMEPSDCNTRRRSICRVTTPTVVDSSATTVACKNTCQTTTDQQENERKSPTYTIYVAPAVASIVCIIVAVMVCLLCKRLRNRSNRKKTTDEISQNASDVHLLEKPQMDESQSPVYAVPNKELKRNSNKANIPSKPQRKTIRNPPALSPYENFNPAETLKKQSQLEQDSEYDHINLNELHKDKTKVSADDDKHVYNHTMDNVEDEYDTCTVKTAKKDNSANPALNNYSSFEDFQANTEQNPEKNSNK